MTIKIENVKHSDCDTSGVRCPKCYDKNRIHRITIHDDFNNLYELFKEIVKFCRFLRLEQHQRPIDISLKTFCQIIDETTFKEPPHSYIEYISKTEAIYGTCSGRTIHLLSDELVIDFKNFGSQHFASDILDIINSHQK